MTNSEFEFILFLSVELLELFPTNKNKLKKPESNFIRLIACGVRVHVLRQILNISYANFWRIKKPYKIIFFSHECVCVCIVFLYRKIKLIDFREREKQNSNVKLK